MTGFGAFVLKFKTGVKDTIYVIGTTAKFIRCLDDFGQRCEKLAGNPFVRLTFAPAKHHLLRQFIAICLLSLQLFTGTELCQLFKAPILFEHYNEHKGGDKGLTFLSFLKEHYLNSSERDPDYARDMQLPFKTNSGLLLAVHSISIPVPGFTIVPPAPAFDIKKQYSFFKGIWQPSQIVYTIFQPPRYSEA